MTCLPPRLWRCRASPMATSVPRSTSMPRPHVCVYARVHACLHLYIRPSTHLCTCPCPLSLSTHSTSTSISTVRLHTPRYMSSFVYTRVLTHTISAVSALAPRHTTDRPVIHALALRETCTYPSWSHTRQTSPSIRHASSLVVGRLRRRRVRGDCLVGASQAGLGLVVAWFGVACRG